MKIAPFVFLLALGGSLLSVDVRMLESFFEQQRYDELERAISSLQTLPDDPSLLFFRGYFQSNPDSAVTYYGRVINHFPNSKYADYALLRLGQYSYFDDDFSTARRHLSRLVRHFPDSEWRDDAQYLYCQCIIAQGKVDSAKLFLKAFVQNVQRSPFVDAAILDLESLGGLPLDTLISQKKSSVGYSIQVASYKDFNDAKDVLYKLARVFPHVEIGERTLGNTKYYNVLIGSFESREKASRYAQLYIQPHLTEYKVVEYHR
ncbi:tetratricopeptide repeat protein [candidate division KSB1 bacterium]|nr:tetratricopeptide repeat protein [candidate division KSB1 bacterium]